MGGGSRRRRRRLLAAAILALIVTLTVAGWFLLRPERDFPAGALDPALPELRVRSTSAWEHEEYRCLLVVADGRVEARTDYEPEDGGPRVRFLGPADEVPWPAGLSTEPYEPLVDRAKETVGAMPRPRRLHDRPAVALAADADAGWDELLGALPGDLISTCPRLYLAGRVGGRTSAVPLSALRLGEHEIAILGAALQPEDLFKGVGANAVTEVRITRVADGVRYRWGLPPQLGRPGPRWMGDEAVRPGAAAPEGLRWRLRNRARIPNRGSLALVDFEAGVGVRYQDALRAVDAAEGDPAVLFVLFPLLADRRVGADGTARLPSPLEPGEHLLLRERRSAGRWRFVNVLSDGAIFVRGRQIWATGIPSDLARDSSFVGLNLRADESAPWSVCREILEVARAGGLKREVAFAPEEPTLPWERDLDLPADPTLPDAAPDAKSGDVLRDILRRLE